MRNDLNGFCLQRILPLLPQRSTRDPGFRASARPHAAHSDGIVGYDRITFMNEQELASQEADASTSLEDNGVAKPAI